MKKSIYNIIGTILILINFYYYHMINTTNISMYLLIFLVFYLLKTTKDKPDKLTKIFSCIFSCFITFGNLELIEIRKIPIIIIILIGWYILFSSLFIFLKNNLKNIKINTNTKKKLSKKKFIIISMVIGIICYIPYLLRFFPGLMNSDPYNQMLQVIHIVPYSDAHPVIHTLLLKIFYTIGYTLTKKEIIGVAFYTIFQMITLSYIYSNILYILYKNNISKVIILLVWAFFFIYPINAIYAITIWKDILFSAIILLFSVFIWNHYNEKEEWNKKNKLLFTILGIIICLLRTNGLLAYTLFIIVLFLIYKDDFIKLKKVIIIIFAIVFVIKIPIYSIFNIYPGDYLESLAIPLQQVAYVIRNDGNISASERKELERVADLEVVKSQKDVWRAQFVSDYVKDNIRKVDTTHYLEKHKFKYLKIWLSIGLKNPVKYIRAFIKQTNGYWYFNIDPYIVYVLSTNTNGREGYYLGFDQKNFLPNNISISMIKYIEKVTDIYYKTWSPAMGLYLTLIALYIFLQKKKNILPTILNIAIVLTLLMATPVSCEFRYAYSLFLGGGILLILSLSKKKDN